MLRAYLPRPSVFLLVGASLPVLHKFTAQCDEKTGTNSAKLDDCLNPACHSTMDLLKKFNLKKKTLPKAIKEADVEENEKSKSNNPYCTGCPVDRDQLGRGTWDLIHTIAATYPEQPSEEQQKHTDMFLRSLSMVYPCPYCATHFQHTIESSPPRLESRESLMLWCCSFHNEVNVMLGKPVFACTPEELDLRWRDGRNECWEGETSHKSTRGNKA